MKYEYEIVKRDDGMYAVCEYRWGDQSVNIKQVYVDAYRKNCKKYLEKKCKNVK